MSKLIELMNLSQLPSLAVRTYLWRCWVALALVETSINRQSRFRFSGRSIESAETGSMSCSDRLSKYNQLLRIEEQLGDQALFAGKGAFKQLS